MNIHLHHFFGGMGCEQEGARVLIHGQLVCCKKCHVPLFEVKTSRPSGVKNASWPHFCRQRCKWPNACIMMRFLCTLHIFDPHCCNRLKSRELLRSCAQDMRMYLHSIIYGYMRGCDIDVFRGHRDRLDRIVRFSSHPALPTVARQSSVCRAFSKALENPMFELAQAMSCRTAKRLAGLLWGWKLWRWMHTRTAWDGWHQELERQEGNHGHLNSEPHGSHGFSKKVASDG